MLAANFDITLDRAADYSFVLTIQNQALGPITLLANEFQGEIRDTYKKKIVDFMFSISGLAVGDVKLSLTETQTQLFKAGQTYSYDIFRVKSSDTVRLIEGSLNVRANTTNNSVI